MLLFALLLSNGVSFGTDYVGRMVVGDKDYTMNRIQVTLSHDTLTLHRVKFSLFMPVYIDVVIPNINRENSQINGKDITPLVHDKPYHKRIIRRLYGNITDSKMELNMLFGDKTMHFVGESKTK